MIIAGTVKFALELPQPDASGAVVPSSPCSLMDTQFPGCFSLLPVSMHYHELPRLPGWFTMLACLLAVFRPLQYPISLLFPQQPSFVMTQ